MASRTTPTSEERETLPSVAMCDWRCGCAARHDVTVGPERTDLMLCCAHMNEAIVQLAIGQPDRVEGLAKFRRHHRQTCGYKP